MPQLRLTTKAAKALKVTTLLEPQEIAEPLDDWCVDLFNIGRKSYFVMMHLKTRLALCVARSAIGGAKNFLPILPSLLEAYFHDIGYPDIAEECHEFFLNADVMAVFTKTANRSVIAHMTQFKTRLEYEAYACGDLTPEALEGCHASWANGLVKIPGSKNDYDRPSAILEQLLGIESTEIASNVIQVKFGEQGI